MEKQIPTNLMVIYFSIYLGMTVYRHCIYLYCISMCISILKRNNNVLCNPNMVITAIYCNINGSIPTHYIMSDGSWLTFSSKPRLTNDQWTRLLFFNSLGILLLILLVWDRIDMLQAKQYAHTDTRRHVCI